MSQIDIDYEDKALQLYNFIKNYTPEGWNEPIKKMFIVPLIKPGQIKCILNGSPPRNNLNKWYFKEAVEKWLELEK